MQQTDRKLIRAANLIRDALVQNTPLNPARPLPAATWGKLVRTAQQCDSAMRRGWCLAARRLEQEFACDLDRLQRQLGDLAAAIRQRVLMPAIPGLGDIYRDLLALEEEFEQVECDLQAAEVCVTTVPITLAGVELGPFQIRLAWDRLGNSDAYRIIALEPNPSVANESVDHPHISDGVLCEGDGRRAIRSALDDGRLLDFFTLVGQLLATYAPGRAYVELDDWFGRPCSECEDNVSSEDCSCCTRCDGLLCESCAACCECCEAVYCSGCLTNCRKCGQACCDSCCQGCKECRTVLCSNCLNDGKCEDCDAKDEDDDEPETPFARATETSVQPDCLGEIAFPA